MSKKIKRRPDYAALYPDLDISADVLAFLKSSDRKMEYIEHDLKRNRVFQDANGKAVRDKKGRPVLLPEREISLDRLLEEDWDFPTPDASPEETVIQRLEAEELYRRIDLLPDDERALIDALFYANDGSGMSERAYAKISGIPQKTINDRKRKIIGMLKKYLEG